MLPPAAPAYPNRQLGCVPHALPMTGAIRCEDKCWCQFLPSARAWRRGAGPLPHMTMATDAATTTDIIPIIPAADRRHRKPMTGTTTVIGIRITRPVHPSTGTMRAANLLQLRAAAAPLSSLRLSHPPLSPPPLLSLRLWLPEMAPGRLRRLRSRRFGFPSEAAEWLDAPGRLEHQASHFSFPATRRLPSQPLAPPRNLHCGK